MRVITLAGSPRYPSRSTALLQHAGKWLTAKGVEVLPWHLHNFPPEDLLNARFDSPALQTLNEQLSTADGVIIATPIYKASFTGGLKALLDVLPERALAHKAVLPIATGGSLAHMLAVDYSLLPVLNALKAQEILQSVFADDSQIRDYDRTPEFSSALQERLQEALENLFQALLRRQQLSPTAAQRLGLPHVFMVKTTIALANGWHARIGFRHLRRRESTAAADRLPKGIGQSVAHKNASATGKTFSGYRHSLD